MRAAFVPKNKKWLRQAKAQFNFTGKLKSLWIIMNMTSIGVFILMLGFCVFLGVLYTCTLSGYKKGKSLLRHIKEGRVISKKDALEAAAARSDAFFLRVSYYLMAVGLFVCLLDRIIKFLSNK